jgi:hypothetical protein
MLRLRQAVLLYAFLIGALLSVAHADGFGILSRHDVLKGLTIIDVGEIEKVDPLHGKPEVNSILKLGLSCYETYGSAGSWSFGRKAGLVLADSSRGIRIAFIESQIGNITVEVFNAIQISCDARGSDASSRDRQRRLEEQGLQEMKRQQELLRFEAERYRQQAEHYRQEAERLRK